MCHTYYIAFFPDFGNFWPFFNKIAKMAIDGKDDRTKLVIKINKEHPKYLSYTKRY